MCKQANRGNLTYYSPLHSERDVGGEVAVCSVREKSLHDFSPHPSRLEKGLDNNSEHAFLARRTCPSWAKKGMFLEDVYNVLISCRL